MKKTLSVLCAAAMLLTLLPGCGSGAKTGAETGGGTASKEQKAEFAPSMDTSASADIEIVGQLENFEALEAVIQDFNAIYPKVTVNYSKLDDYGKTVVQQVLGSDPPEIFMSYKTYFAADSALTDATIDLNDIGIDSGIVNPAVLDSCAADGKMIRVPLMLNYQGFVVNDTLLEKEGLQIPSTYDEFISVCDALVGKGYTPLQGYSETFYNSLLFNEWRVRLSREADPGKITEELNTGADGSGKYLAKTFGILEDYREKGYFSEDVNSKIADNYDAAIMSFFEGDTPFLVCSAETMSGMKKRETKSAAYSADPFDYEFVELPVSDMGATAVIDVWKGFSISKNSKSVDWAEEFIRFLFTTDELNKMAEIKGMPTVAEKGNGDQRYAALDNLTDDQKIFIGTLDIQTAVTNTFKKYSALVGCGECTADEAEAQFPAAVREALAADK